MNIVVKWENVVASVTVQHRESESVRVSNSTAICWWRRAQDCCLWVSYCTSSHYSDSVSWGVDPCGFSLLWVFHVNILCIRVLYFLSLSCLFSIFAPTYAYEKLVVAGDDPNVCPAQEFFIDRMRTSRPIRFGMHLLIFEKPSQNRWNDPSLSTCTHPCRRSHLFL